MFHATKLIQSKLFTVYSCKSAFFMTKKVDKFKFLYFLRFSFKLCISELEVKTLNVTDIRIKEFKLSAVSFGYKHSLFFADYRLYTLLHPFFRTEWSFVTAD